MDRIIYEEQSAYILSLRKKNTGLLLEMEEYAKENRIPILDKNSAGLLKKIVSIKNPSGFLEIGTAIGYSAIIAASIIREGGIVDTIEKSKDNITKAKSFIGKSGLGSKINIIEGDAIDILPKIGNEYEFVFLDADKEDYLELFRLIIPVVAKGGVLFVDNLLWHGYAASLAVPRKYESGAKHIRDFNQIFMNSDEFDSDIFTVGDGIGIAIKKY